MSKKTMKKYIYTEKIGIEAVEYIKTLGLNAKLIGSLLTKGYSNHDIDILVKTKKIIDRQKVIDILAKDCILNPELYYNVEYNQAVFEGTCFGNLNIFFY